MYCFKKGGDELQNYFTILDENANMNRPGCFNF